jgi:hypothetical protein
MRSEIVGRVVFIFVSMSMGRPLPGAMLKRARVYVWGTCFYTRHSACEQARKVDAFRPEDLMYFALLAQSSAVVFLSARLRRTFSNMLMRPSCILLRTMAGGSKVEARGCANSERLIAPLKDRSPRRVDLHPMRTFDDPFPVLSARVVR